MSIEQNKSVTRRWHADLYRAGKYEVADEICTPGLQMHGTGVPADVAPGTAFLKQDAEAYNNAFTIEQLSDDAVIAEGDQVAIRWTLKATHTGELEGIAPTERTVELTGIDIFRLEDGRIAEFWTELNMMSLMEQLGALPASSPA